jgi:hypothetical protein
MEGMEGMAGMAGMEAIEVATTVTVDRLVVQAAQEAPLFCA